MFAILRVLVMFFHHSRLVFLESGLMIMMDRHDANPVEQLVNQGQIHFSDAEERVCLGPLDSHESTFVLLLFRNTRASCVSVVREELDESPEGRE